MFLCFTSYSQSNSYQTKAFTPKIKTIQIFQRGWQMSYPIIELNSDSRVELRFDELVDDAKNYTYKIVHCNADWTKSDISEFDYLEGFQENQLENYEFSLNANIMYVHYNLEIPNEDIKLKISGNYIIEVLDEDSNIVVTARFCVVEQTIEILGAVKRCRFDKSETHQKFDFKINPKDLEVSNAFSELKVVVAQNNRWSTALKNLKPVFIRDKFLIYEYDEDKGIFPGNNEFRKFDITNLTFNGLQIKNIDKRGANHFVELYADPIKQYKDYEFVNDINGKTLIKVHNREDSHVGADYVYVDFKLPYIRKRADGDFYVIGNFNNWQCDSLNKLTFNYDENAYKLRMFLKQGYYNYMYAFKNKEGEIINFLTEGSHDETENDYLIYVYYRGFADRYDKLVGFALFNNIKKI